MSDEKESGFEKTNRTGAYIRVSDESQVDGHSLDAQQREIERWCENHKYAKPKLYIDAGVSAYADTIEKRLELIRLLKDAENGLIDIMVVHTLDRLSRKLSVQMQVLDRLAKVKVGFASVNDPFDYSTLQGRLILNQIGGYNEFFSGLLGIHVRKAFHFMVETGLTVGPVPFGYKRQEDKKLPPLKVDKEAEAVGEMFQRRADGQSYGEIATWVNSQNFHTRDGNLFKPHAIKDILNNQFYSGFVKYNKKLYPGKHEAIISQEIFKRVQDRKQTKKIIREVHGPKGLLQGIVVCSTCGNRLHSDRKNQTIPMYRERHAHECPTNETSIIAEVFDKQIAVLVHSLDIKPDWKQQMAKVAVTTYEGPKPEELREKRRRLGKAYANEAFGDTEYEMRLAEIDRQLEQASVTTPPDIEDAIELFSNLPMLWNEATTEERRELLKSLVELVYVDIKTKRVTAIKPTPAFRVLYGVGINSGPDTPIKLMFHDETPILLDLVETGEA